MIEQDLLNRVLAAVGAMPGVLAWRNNTGALKDLNGRLVRFGHVGSPDVLVIAAGRFVGIECKTRTGRQRPDQVRWQRACEAAGGVYVLARDVETASAAVRAVLVAPESEEERAFRTAFFEALGLAEYLDYMREDAASIAFNEHIQDSWNAFKGR